MSLYLDIEKARFDKDFEYEINTENISDLEHKIPSMSVSYTHLDVYKRQQPRPLTLSLGKNEIYIGAEKDLVYKLNFKKLVTEKIFETENNHATGQIFADTITNNLFFTSFKFNILKNNKIISDYAVAIKDVKKVDHKYFSFAASGISGLFSIDENLKSDWDLIFNKNKSKEFSGFGQAMLINLSLIHI